MRVLLVSHGNWHGPARFPQALKKVGCDVAAVCAKGDWISYTRYVDRFYFVTNWTGRPFLEHLIHAIENWQPDLILPATDNMVSALQHLRDLVDRGEALLSPEMAAVLRNSTFDPKTAKLVDGKIDFLEELRKRGVRVPPQRDLKTMGDADAFVQEHGYPVLLKPDVGCAGQGILFCPDEESLLRNLRGVLLGGERGRYCIQKYLGNRTALIEFAAKDGKLVAYNCAQRMRTHPGEMGPVTVLRIVESAEMVRAAEAMCELLGYNGIGVPQFVVEDDSCEVAHLMELNPRMSHFPHLWQRLGTDLAGALVGAWSGQSVHPKPVQSGLMVALWPQEALRDPESEFLKSRHDRVEDDPELLDAYERMLQLPAAK